MLNTHRGFSLIELMIAIAIGLVISTGMLTVFVSSTKARQEINRFGEQIENGRIAMDTISQDLRTAGFWDGLDYTRISVTALGGSLPNPCVVPATASDSANLTLLRQAMAVFVQGYDEDASSLGCLTDVRANTDVLVVRRAATCTYNSATCVGGVYFQSSKCHPPYVDPTDGSTGPPTGSPLPDEELADESASGVDNWYRVSMTMADLNRHDKYCAHPTKGSAAAIRPYLVHIYYIANNTEGSDGIPALKRLSLGAGSFSVETVATGIEQLQLEYGRDISSPSDGTPDAYSPVPVANAAAVPALTVLDAWRQVVTVKVHLLARNTSVSPQYTDTKSYVLGYDANNAERVFGPYGDGIRRHAYSSEVFLSIPAGLRGS